jgi:predicted RNA-binding protein with PIN domain
VILIDGHNLIGKLPNISLSDPDDEAKLIVLLRSHYVQNPREPIQVVFDPGKEGGLPGVKGGAGVSVRYAPRGTTADAIIMRILREATNARSITVVTSDNEVRNVARAQGALLLSSQEFADRLFAHSPKRGTIQARSRSNGDKPANPEVDFWMEQFKQKKRR